MKQSLFRYVLGLSLSVVVLPFSLKAQDFHYSQYYAAPLTLNPALTGQFNGQYRANLNYRSQWTSIGNPYHTAHAAFDLPLSDKWSLGASILDQNAAGGAYNSLQAVVSASYDIALGVDKYNHLLLGIGAGINNRSFDPSRITFGDQYNIVTASVAGPSAEVFDKTSKLVPEVNAGLLFYDGNPFRTVNYFVGATAFHLPEFNQNAVANTTSPLYRRYLVHGGVRIKATRALEVIPQAMGMYQNNAREIIPSLALQYHLPDADAFLIGGASYRIDDAIVPYAGIQYKEYSLGLSYDITLSDLNAANNSRGGLEISLIYIKKPKVARPKFICPRI